jgi:hypothetical protein
MSVVTIDARDRGHGRMSARSYLDHGLATRSASNWRRRCEKVAAPRTGVYKGLTCNFCFSGIRGVLEVG